MSDSAIRRITLLSFRTFGDYVLKAPFLFELGRRYPNAEVTMITNRKGGQVYPLVDARLKLVVVDHGDPKPHLLRTLFAHATGGPGLRPGRQPHDAGALSGGSRQTEDGMGPGD